MVDLFTGLYAFPFHHCKTSFKLDCIKRSTHRGDYQDFDVLSEGPSPAISRDTFDTFAAYYLLPKLAMV